MRLRDAGLDLPKPDHNYISKIVALISTQGTERKIKSKLTDKQKNDGATPALLATREALWKKPRHLWASQDGLSRAIGNYGISTIETALKNNVWMHFHNRFRRYVETNLDKEHKQGSRILGAPPASDEASRVKRVKAIGQLCEEITQRERKSKGPPQKTRGVSPDEKARGAFVSRLRSRLPPRPASGKAANLAYHLKSNWDKYLPLMIDMNRGREEDELKLFSVVPLKRSVIPQSMGFSTKTLNCLERTAWERKCSTASDRKTAAAMLKRLSSSQKQDERSCWARLFNYQLLENHTSKFTYVMNTDGRSFCLHMSTASGAVEASADQEDAKDNTTMAESKKRKLVDQSAAGDQVRTKRTKTGTSDSAEAFDRKASESPRARRRRRRWRHRKFGTIDLADLVKLAGGKEMLRHAQARNGLAGVDPGKHELLSIATLEFGRLEQKQMADDSKSNGDHSDTKPKHKALRRLFYTAACRRQESGQLHHRDARKELERKFIGDDKAKRRSVERCSEQLKETCSKSSTQENFSAYLELKWRLLDLMGPMYRLQPFRDMRYNAWAGRRRSENELVQRIRQKFGRGVILMMGDWSKTFRMHFRGLAPSPGVGLRRRLAQDFLVVNVPEAYTSQRCSQCGSELEAPRRRVPKSKRRKPLEEQKEVEVRGLRKCTSTDCGIYWNRDFNSARCILRNALHFVENGAYLYGQTPTLTSPVLAVAPPTSRRLRAVSVGSTAVSLLRLPDGSPILPQFQIPNGADPRPSLCCL